ncbi:unnamed protein product [Didymodactylos carnosus]|uniref:Uncharacterized protein n=1 Tax=Didymodactylos carnosus TaxID=1234261 RepID=A0A813PBJ7_9BILA|nr:unnamed protein product [Didymodactylos carnosus]CAF3530653.1 unnamed protein product [Didymodactylos carnosus]
MMNLALTREEAETNKSTFQQGISNYIQFQMELPVNMTNWTSKNTYDILWTNEFPLLNSMNYWSNETMVGFIHSSEVAKINQMLVINPNTVANLYRVIRRKRFDPSLMMIILTVLGCMGLINEWHRVIFLKKTLRRYLHKKLIRIPPLTIVQQELDQEQNLNSQKLDLIEVENDDILRPSASTTFYRRPPIFGDYMKLLNNFLCDPNVNNVNNNAHAAEMSVMLSNTVPNLQIMSTLESSTSHIHVRSPSCTSNRDPNIYEKYCNYYLRHHGLFFDNRRIDYSWSNIKIPFIVRESLPLVFIYPDLLPNKEKCEFEGGQSYLIITDILFPSLLLNFCRLFDICNGIQSRVYYIQSLCAYIFSLLLSQLINIILQCRQPSSLIVYPIILFSTILTSIIRKEFKKIIYGTLTGLDDCIHMINRQKEDI